MGTSGGRIGKLEGFRRRLHGCFGRRADALFELIDAILTAGNVPSPVHLSLEAVHRRGWGSLYAALSKGRIDEEALRDLLARHPFADRGMHDIPVYAVDLTTWPRCDPRAAPSEGTITTPRGTRPVGPSSPAGPTNSSPR